MKHGCNGRPPLRETMLVKDGYWSEPGPELFTRMTRFRVVEIKIQTSKECQYTQQNPEDQACEGCSNRTRHRMEGGDQNEKV